MNYLYNGVELPALPDGLAESYPYIVITQNSNGNALFAAKTQWRRAWYHLGYYVVSAGSGNYREQYTLSSDGQSWVYKGTIGNSLNDYAVFWTTHDVYNGTETSIGTELWLAASDPVPVPAGEWTTLFDGEVSTEDILGVQHVAELIAAEQAEHFFNSGDKIKLTVNEKTFLYTAQEDKFYAWANPCLWVGNPYLLNDYYAGDDGFGKGEPVSDNGEDFAVCSSAALLPINKFLDLYCRTPGTYTVKVERLIASSSEPQGTELLYLRSTGTQYIDTGYIPNQNTRVVCRAKVPNTSGTNWVFGARQSSSSKLFTFAWSTNGCFVAAYNNGSQRFANEWNTEEDILVDFDGNTCSMTTEKGTASASLSVGSFTCPVSMTLFAGNTNGSVTKGSITVYSFRIYENGELLRDLAPWKHTDGRIGMWDKVSETFFENAGTGVFEFEKIPAQVPSIDHTAMVQGWIVGKRLAAMRKDKKPDPPVPDIPEETSGIYSVTWDYTNKSTKLTRGDNAADFGDPVPAAALTETGSSPFDSIMPWAGMKRFNVVDGQVACSAESEDFSMTTKDTVVFIPEFYYRVEQDEANGMIKWSISAKAADGFEKHPGSGRYVGRYHTSNNNGVYCSYSGRNPVASITRATARTNSHARGDNWWMLDIATWSAIQILYLVEFADWDSQGVLGGGQNSDVPGASGSTDTAVYHTLKRSGASNQYRWIEDLWSNAMDWVDGFVASGKVCYTGTDSASFGDATDGLTTPGVTLPGEGFMSMLGVSESVPWAFLPKIASGGEGTYIPDYVYSSTGVRVLCVGGSYDLAHHGLFCFNAGNKASQSRIGVGSRLIYIP